MESRAITEFMKLVDSVCAVTQSIELKTAIARLKEAADAEKSYQPSDDSDLIQTRIDLEDKIEKAEVEYNEEVKIHDQKLARINSTLADLKDSLDEAFRSGKLNEFKDFVIYTELGMQINEKQQDLELAIEDETCCGRLFSFCCAPKTISKTKAAEKNLQKKQDQILQESKNTARDKFVNETSDHIYRLRAEKTRLEKNPPQKKIDQYQTELKAIMKRIALHKKKQLDSVNEETMLQIIAVYKTYVAVMKITGQTENPLMFSMDKITCRDKNFCSASYIYGIGTPRRNKLFQIPESDQSLLPVGNPRYTSPP